MLHFSIFDSICLCCRQEKCSSFTGFSKICLSPFFFQALSFLQLPSIFGICTHRGGGEWTGIQHLAVGHQKSHSEMVGIGSFGHWRTMSWGSARVSSTLNIRYKWGMPIFKLCILTFESHVVKPLDNTHFSLPPESQTSSFLGNLPGRQTLSSEANSYMYSICIFLHSSAENTFSVF